MHLLRSGTSYYLVVLSDYCHFPWSGSRKNNETSLLYAYDLHTQNTCIAQTDTTRY